MPSKPVALVTGGARRVGRAVVEHLVAGGWRVVFTYHRSKDAAVELQERYWNAAEDGFDALAVEADVSSLDECARRIDHAIDSMGRLDLLVNNASVYAPDDELSADRAMAVNYVGPVTLTRRLAPRLKSTRGSVINMLDILAERPMTHFASYCASKAALWNQTLALARELAPDVRVNGIAPGVVDWPDDLPQAQREQYLRKVPLGRAGTRRDVATLVKFLASEGTYITGEVIRLDGGRSVVW
jgi:pteridine reductase